MPDILWTPGAALLNWQTEMVVSFFQKLSCTLLSLLGKGFRGPAEKGQSDNQTSDKKGDGCFIFPVADHCQGPGGRASPHVLWVQGEDHVPDSCDGGSGVYTVCVVSGQPGMSRNPDGRGGEEGGTMSLSLGVAGEREVWTLPETRVRTRQTTVDEHLTTT